VAPNLYAVHYAGGINVGCFSNRKITLFLTVHYHSEFMSDESYIVGTVNCTHVGIEARPPLILAEPASTGTCISISACSGLTTMGEVRWIIDMSGFDALNRDTHP
jgi:hypothetical protein